MVKVMIFIDGTWLFSNRLYLIKNGIDQEVHIDYELFPKVIISKVQNLMKIPDMDVIRTYLFGSIAVNYDLRDEEVVQKRADFFDMLKKEFHYDVVVYPVDFRGRRLSKRNRDPEDDFEPKEKCVDIALASSLLYFAAIPNAYDIAITVVGDRDYLPALRYARQLGKRVVIVSIKGSCSMELADSSGRYQLKDTDIIWLNDIASEIDFKYTPVNLECQSPLHKGDKMVMTTFRPRKGMPFYCNECRRQFAEQKSLAQQEYITNSLTEVSTELTELSQSPEYRGTVYKILQDKGFGFIKGVNGLEYFFHLTDFEGIDWNFVTHGMDVMFQVKRAPANEKAGAAGKIRVIKPVVNTDKEFDREL